MRHGRAKAARRTLQFFRLNVGIRPPYHVLCDGCFLVAMVSQKVPLVERLEKVLQHAQFSLHVTRSALDELQSLHEQTKREEFGHARQYGLDECEILESKDIPPLEGDEEETDQADLGQAGTDIIRLVSSKHYVVGTQDETLLDLLRYRGTVPIVRLARGVTLLENPSKASQNRASTEERHKWKSGAVNQYEREWAQHVREENKKTKAEDSRQPQTHTRMKHKAKGPNPLSCKKKRPEEENTPKKRKRRRKNKSGVTAGESEL